MRGVRQGKHDGQRGQVVSVLGQRGGGKQKSVQTARGAAKRCGVVEGERTVQQQAGECRSKEG